jgi:hypothetical protein
MNIKRLISQHGKRRDWWFLLAIFGLALMVLLTIKVYQF